MAEATATVQQEWVDRYYSQEQLKDKRQNFLRSCHYAMFLSGRYECHRSKWWI